MYLRVAILGNAGSGKTYLAAAIAKAWSIPVIDIDTIFWMPGGYMHKRPSDAVHSEIAERKAEDRWLIEGVYGELVSLLLDRATFLVWLDIPWPICLASIMERRMRSPDDDPQNTGESFQALLSYAGAYATREDLRSQRGHRLIYDQFPHAKRYFRTRDDVNAFIETL